MLRVAVQDGSDVLKGAAGEAAHVKAQPKEMRVEERCQQAVPQQKGSEQDPSKDGHLGVGDEAHRGIVVGFDPCMHFSQRHPFMKAKAKRKSLYSHV